MVKQYDIVGVMSATERYVASPKQIQFHQAEADEVFFGGAVGGGKSYAILWDAVFFCLNHKNITSSIFRRTYPELEKSVILEALRVVPIHWFTYNKKEHRMYFKETGSILEFNYCLYDTDVYQFQSAQYDRLYFDELTHFNKFQYIYLLSRLRTTKDIKTQAKSASNPGNVGHEWVKKRFISDEIPGKEIVRTDPETGSSYTTIYIPSRLADNEYLMKDETYVKNLMKLDKEDRKALLEGDWDILKGQFFEEWRYDLHVCKPTTIPSWWVHIRCMDWGYAKPACVLWIAFDPQGDAWVYRELVVTKTSDTELANKIRELTGKQKINYTVADPSIWSVTQYERGESVAYRLVQAGVDVIKGDNNRISGWNVIHSYLKHDMEKQIKPKLHVFDTCSYLIESLPGLIHDEHDPEDLNCFVAGTKVITKNGEKNIESIQVGDMVETPVGFRKVTMAGKSGKGKVMTVTLSNGKKLTGTPNHKVYVTGKGLVELSKLHVSDILKEKNTIQPLWQLKKLFIKGLYTVNQEVENTIVLMERILKKVTKNYTDKSTLIVTDRSLKDSTYTTKIIIATTMSHQTLRQFLQHNISNIITDFHRNGRKLDTFGIEAKWGEKYYTTTLSLCVKTVLKESYRAEIVETLLQQEILYRFFVSIVKNIKDKLRKIVPFVVKSFFKRKMVGKPHKPVHIVAVGNLEKPQIVYNLTVEEAHLYYSNGILVTNTKGDDHAADALRYGLMTKPTKPRSPIISAPQGTVSWWINKFDRERKEKGYVGTL